MRRLMKRIRHPFQASCALAKTATTTRRTRATPRLAVEALEDRIVLSGGAQAYIGSLYTTYLGRSGSAAELDSWANQLSGKPRQVIANAILGSHEAHVHKVDSLYETYLGRQADPAGEAAWANALDTGTPLETVIDGLVSSQEYYNRANTSGGSSSDVDFVQALYRNFLGRTASGGEANGWVAQLGNLGRPGVANSFVHSTEYRADVVGGFYTGMLGRPASPAEVAGWVNSPMSISTIELSFAGCDEFYNRVVTTQVSSAQPTSTPSSSQNPGSGSTGSTSSSTPAPSQTTSQTSSTSSSNGQHSGSTVQLTPAGKALLQTLVDVFSLLKDIAYLSKKYYWTNALDKNVIAQAEYVFYSYYASNTSLTTWINSVLTLSGMAYGDDLGSRKVATDALTVAKDLGNLNHYVPALFATNATPSSSSLFSYSQSGSIPSLNYTGYGSGYNSGWVTGMIGGAEEVAGAPDGGLGYYQSIDDPSIF